MFLPQDYTAPKTTSHYLKLQDGENRIRILSKPVFGWEDWQDRKPVRFTMDSKPKPSDPKKPVKHFWSFIVWNVNEAQIQIMQITQKSIQKFIESLSRDEDWGLPFEYDIKINREGEGMETEYTVNPVPHKPVSQEILDAFKERPINLDALFSGGDPFAQGQDNYTLLMTANEPPKKAEIKPLYASKVSDEQFVELSELRIRCNADAQKGFDSYIKKIYGAEKIQDLLEIDYQKIKDLLIKKIHDLSIEKKDKALLEAEMKDVKK